MSVIEVESLLSEIAADAPCGEDLEYDSQFVEMEKQSQGTPERQYGDTIIPANRPTGARSARRLSICWSAPVICGWRST